MSNSKTAADAWKAFADHPITTRVLRAITSAYGVVFVAAGIIVIAFFWPASPFYAGEGLILLDTPQVFTRGRLVNDRATEQTWLETQLRETDNLLREGRFATTQEIREAQRGLAVAITTGNSNPAPQQLGDDDLRKRLAALELKATPQEQFEDASLYRLAIRNTLMSTVLDDRHDIEGNTIYRLNFNVSVVPPQGSSDRVAIVVVDLHETSPARNPKNEDALRSAYVDLLHDWRSKLQDALVNLVEDRRATIEDYSGFLEPVENNEFNKWLVEHTREHLRNLFPNDSESTTDGFIEDIRRVYTEALTTAYFRNVDRLAEDLTKLFVQRDPVGFRMFVRNQCAVKGKIGPEELLPPEIAKKSKLQPFVCREKKTSPLVIRLDILDIVAMVRKHRLIDGNCPRREFLPDFIAAIGVDGYWEHAPKPCQQSVQRARSMRTLARPDERRGDLLALFEAKTLVSKESKSSLSLTTDPETGKPLPLSFAHFFDYVPPPQCAPGACPPTLVFSKDVNSAASELMKVVRPTAKAFTYSVTPNKLVRRSDVSQRMNLNLSAGATQASAPNVVASSAAQSALRGLETDPTIIGFGDWDSSPEERAGVVQRILCWMDLGGCRSGTKLANTKFGWAMFPRPARDGTQSRQHLPENYSVSATVSLPGWWKTAHLSVRTCWISQADIGTKVDLAYLCPQSTSRAFDLRLPGNAEELIQHLRFEVIRTPFLERPKEDPEIQVGREAKIMIRGGRLWRSPVVKLDNQMANRIEVLPDMTGIIVTFDCVRPLPPPVVPPDPPDPAGRDPVNLYLVTSEGKLPFPVRIMVKPFTPIAGAETVKDACYFPKPRVSAESEPPKKGKS